MLYSLLSSRWLQLGLLFFVVVVGGSQLYSWHEGRQTALELAEHARFLKSLKARQANVQASGSSVDTSGGPEVVEFSQLSDEKDSENKGLSGSTAESSDDTVLGDLTGSLLPDDFVLEGDLAESEDVPVSPYGFGPYPEAPADYPYRDHLPWYWTEEENAEFEEAIQPILDMRGVSFRYHMEMTELSYRVGIKLWEEGHRFNGMTTLDSTNRIYPMEPGVIYVKWKEVVDPDGSVRRYMGKTLGSLQDVPISVMRGYEPPPDWLDIRSLDEGIDPYEFLGLSR